MRIIFCSPSGEFDWTLKNSYTAPTLILRPIHFIGAPNFSSCSLKYLFRLEEIVYLFVLKKLEVWNGRDRVQVSEFL